VPDNRWCESTHPATPTAQSKLPKLQAAIEASLVRPTPFYMLANQYLLLDLHRAKPNDFAPNALGGTELGDIHNHPFLKALRPQQRVDKLLALTGVPGGVSRRIDIVGFNDPNDDLSFLLSPFSDSELTVENVLVQNDNEYLRFFENPGPAHLGYYQDPNHARILDVIFCGMTVAGVAKC
jgi:hypothetical protein